MQDIKMYLGPMTKNIVDAIINYNTNINNSIGIISSRRQIDYKGGYVNNWNTESFYNYIKSKNKDIIICRDHGGINQGKIKDDGIDSLLEDAKYMDIIHIDPFKKYDIDDSINYTIDIIKKCSLINDNCLFEIGTEEAIFPMTIEMLKEFILSIKKKIPILFSKIKYAVIQSGTSLKSGINTGNYNKDKLIGMNDVCLEYGLLSKEHNGDYLNELQIKEKFNLGLSAINIAPEIAHIETEYIINNINISNIDRWFNLVINDGSWSKWFLKDFNPIENKKTILRLCGHYVLNHPDFKDIFKLELASNYVNEEVQKFINNRI